jgi:hypothetical protein
LGSAGLESVSDDFTLARFLASPGIDV